MVSLKDVKFTEVFTKMTWVLPVLRFDITQKEKERERERERASTVDPIDYAIVVCSQQLLVLH